MNHEVIAALAKRVGAEHPAFAMTPREIIDWTLTESGYGDLAALETARWLDCQPPFEEAHFLNGFSFPDGKFRFKPDWTHTPLNNEGPRGPWRNMPRLPDHWPVNEDADDRHPFKLATSPAHNFLDSSFTETTTSLKRERRPELMISPGDAAGLGVEDGDRSPVKASSTSPPSTNSPGSCRNSQCPRHKETGRNSPSRPMRYNLMSLPVVVLHRNRSV